MMLCALFRSKFKTNLKALCACSTIIRRDVATYEITYCVLNHCSNLHARCIYANKTENIARIVRWQQSLAGRFYCTKCYTNLIRGGVPSMMNETISSSSIRESRTFDPGKDKSKTVGCCISSTDVYRKNPKTLKTIISLFWNPWWSYWGDKNIGRCRHCPGCYCVQLSVL